jgi:hypothetical protein
MRTIDATLHPRPRRAPIATLLALLALGTLAQALAPAGAAATINQSTGAAGCASVGGTWSAPLGACLVSDGSGGWVVVRGEIVPVSGKAPGSGCVFCNPPNQIGDGAGRSGEVAKPDPTGHGAVGRPEKVVAKSDLKKRDKAIKQQCLRIVSQLKAEKKTIWSASRRLQGLVELEKENSPFDLRERTEQQGRKAAAERRRLSLESDFLRADCYYHTGIPLPNR